MVLRNDSEGLKGLVIELNQRFHAMKTYGKEPESLESITAIFARDLADYPADKIMKAIKTHSQRSQEFPTVADIIGLIKRNGKTAPTKEMYISASKMDYEDRSYEQHRIIKEYEAEYHESEWGTEHSDPVKAESHLLENAALRNQIAELRRENDMAWNEIKTLRQAQAKAPEPSKQDRINKTIEFMKQSGSSQADIETFLLSV